MKNSVLKKAMMVICLALVFLLCLYGGREEGTAVDFPFPYNAEGYTLTLIPPEDAGDEYVLKLCNEAGTLIQQFPCGVISQPVRFSFDSLSNVYYPDLQIFSSGSRTGLLFAWDGEKFSEEPIQIPMYDEVRRTYFTVTAADGKYREKKLCRVNMAKGKVNEIRRWLMQTDTGNLEIRDCVEGRNLYNGRPALDEAGNLLHAEFYDFLFWDGLYAAGRDSETASIPTWVSEKEDSSETDPDTDGKFEYIQKAIFGNSGYATEYEDRQAFLSDFGFEDTEPVYQYYDMNHNLQLELYLDAETGKGCGIACTYQLTDEMQENASLYGFTIDTIWEQEWKESDPYSLTSIDGTDGSAEVKEYGFSLEKTEDGRPDYYKSQGVIEWLRDDADKVSSVLEINFIYRDDGSLFFRKYSHNSYLFGTTFCSMKSYYDGAERLLYENGYITHGNCEFYYIYENAGRKPAYCLSLDYNTGLVIPTLVRYVP